MISACKQDPPEPPQQDIGNIMFVFEHMVNGNPLQIDTMLYTNAAGNEYLVTEVQYFISDVILHSSESGDILIDDWKDIHYVDNDIESTMIWSVFDDIPMGNYDSISFTFGITKEKNISLMYVNPPDRDMFWPEVLGGGYHYLKLNGKWKDDSMTQNLPFEFHLGIGQIYSGDTINVNDITGYVHNDFRVTMDESSFGVGRDQTAQIPIIMNIENWFQNPNIYDHADYADNIMQDQDAMNVACENGKDVFAIGKIQIMIP